MRRPAADHTAIDRLGGGLAMGVGRVRDRADRLVRARFPHVREILVIADGINQFNASSDDIVRQWVDRLRSAGAVQADRDLRS